MGTETLLRLIGDLPTETPLAFEPAFGWGWLVQLLEEYGFDRTWCPAAVQGHHLSVAAEQLGRRRDPDSVAAGG
jgi:hypothetical protein